MDAAEVSHTMLSTALEASTQLENMSFDEILDLTADVLFCILMYTYYTTQRNPGKRPKQWAGELAVFSAQKNRRLRNGHHAAGAKHNTQHTTRDIRQGQA